MLLKIILTNFLLILIEKFLESKLLDKPTILPRLEHAREILGLFNLIRAFNLKSFVPHKILKLNLTSIWKPFYGNLNDELRKILLYHGSLTQMKQTLQHYERI